MIIVVYTAEKGTEVDKFYVDDKIEKMWLGVIHEAPGGIQDDALYLVSAGNWTLVFSEIG